MKWCGLFVPEKNSGCLYMRAVLHGSEGVPALLDVSILWK